MKTFEIWENIDYNGDGSEKVSLGYIKAKNIENASKRALKQFLSKEQRKNAIINMSDHDLESYDFETKYYNDNGDKLEPYEDHENVCVESHELVIEEIEE